MKYHTKTEVEFWKIVGPAAVIMGFLVFLIVIYKKYGHKELVAAHRERRLPKERKPDLDRGKEKGKGVKGEAEKEKARRREEGERKREEENEKDAGETDKKNRNSRLSGATTMMSSSAALSMSQTTTSPAAQATDLSMFQATTTPPVAQATDLSMSQATKTMTTSPVAQTTTPSTPQAPVRIMTHTAGISISRTTAPSTSYATSFSAAAPPTPPAPVFPGTFQPTSTTVDGNPELLPPARKQSLFGDWWNKYLRSSSQAESRSLV